MTEAENFKALGKGNGFPFCLDKFDMTDFETDNPLQLETTDYTYWTFEQAMKFYWTLETIVTSDGDITTTDSPKSRVCYGAAANTDFGGGNGGGFDISAIVKLYNGDKTNETNLLGYACGPPFEQVAGITGDNPATLGNYSIETFNFTSPITLEGFSFYESHDSEGAAPFTGLDFFTFPA